MPAMSADTWAGMLNFSAYRCSLTAKATHYDEVWNKASTVNYGTNDDGSIRRVQLYSVNPSMFVLDLDFTYQISQHFTFFASGKNVLNKHRQNRQVDALDLMPEYARVTGNYEFGVQITSGISVQF
jgi:outer membrane receptor protein involved in Fe transport